MGADPAQIVFTGSGTEANNQALRASGRERVLVSAIEHEAVLRARPEYIRTHEPDTLLALLAAAKETAGE